MNNTRPAMARAPGTIAGLYVAAIAQVENGAWPAGLDNAYSADHEALADYAAAAATAEGFSRWFAGKTAQPAPA